MRGSNYAGLLPFRGILINCYSGGYRFPPWSRLSAHRHMINPNMSTVTHHGPLTTYPATEIVLQYALISAQLSVKHQHT